MNAPNDLLRPRAHQRILSDAQIDAYRDTGYLTVRNASDRGLLERLIATTERLYSFVETSRLVRDVGHSVSNSGSIAMRTPIYLKTRRMT